jgi:Alpha/beta hydrolase
MLDQPLPEDPQQFADFWRSLSKEQKDYLYGTDHNIGNHPGMPVGDDDYPGSDHYNRLNLADPLSRAQAAAAQADALRAQHPDWANGQNLPRNIADAEQYAAWQRQYSSALNGSKYLSDLQAVNKAVADHPDRKLMLLDTQSGRQTRAAVAVGDPDTATHVSVTAPGLNTTVHGAITGMADEATRLRDEALN